MKDMRAILEEFLKNSTPEQLRAELTKGNRPFFQTLEDPEFLCANHAALPVSIAASVSFFSGNFAQVESGSQAWEADCATKATAANEELALAA